MNRYILPIDGALIRTTPSQSGSESNGNEAVLHIPQTPQPEPHHQMHFNVILRIVSDFKRCYLTITLLLDIIHSLAECLIVSSIAN